LWLCACASAPAPEDRYFRLIAPELEARAEPRLEGSLLVKRFSGDGLLAQRAVAYADSAAPQALFQYHYQSWSDPPTALLQQLSVDLLRAAGVARMVVTPAHGVVPDYVLVGRIRRLEHLVGESPAVAVALELGLSRESDRRVLLLRSYERVLAVERPGVGAAVAAMNRAVNEVLRQFVADLDAL
jgi:ABC-type uncharacterized transport system auxiliary subunit